MQWAPSVLPGISLVHPFQGYLWFCLQKSKNNPWVAFKHISSASKGSSWAQRRRSLMGCPEWPKMSMAPNLKPHGLPGRNVFSWGNRRNHQLERCWVRMIILQHPRAKWFANLKGAIYGTIGVIILTKYIEILIYPFPI